MRSTSICTVALLLGVTACAKQAAVETSSVNAFIHKQTAYVVDEVEFASNYPGAVAQYDLDAVQVVGPQTPELDTVVNAVWNGSLEQLTRKVARSIGYSVRLNGERLATPTIAAVNSNNLTALGLLRQAFAQGRGRIVLTVDTRNRVLVFNTIRSERSPIPHQSDVRL